MKTLFPLLTLLFFSFSLMAQVGINTPTPDSNSVLDLKSKTKGLLIPRMTTLQREGMSSVKFSQGMMVYDITLDILFVGYGNGALSAKWYAMNPWKTEYRKGNNASKANMTTMTVNPSSFVGNSGVHYGNVGIGVLAPTEKLHVAGKVKATGFVGNATTATTVTGATQIAIKTVGTLTKLNVTGNVGIGTASPGAKLQVNGESRFKGTNRITHFNYSTDEHTYIRGGKTSSNVFINDNGGKVGIGTTSPTYELSVSGSVQCSNWFRTTGNGGWYSQTHGGGWHMTDNTWIRNYNNKPVYLKAATVNDIALEVSGRVGIGTASPSYPLHVAGHPGGSTSNRKYISEATLTCGTCTNHKTSTSNNFGIYTSDGILTDWVSFHSDKRIKDVIGVSNSKADLSTLISIEVTDYKRIDKILYGEKITKKLIAQQVKSVFPEAVRLTKDIIPNIYELAEIKEGYIALETDLEKGDRVKLIFEENEQIVEVVKTNKNGFFIDNEKEGKVFVYGKEVDDFHVVDYDAISMLNVSATQELHKIITSQQKIIQNLKNQLSSQGTRLEETKINQSDFEARLKSLETEDSITISNK